MRRMKARLVYSLWIHTVIAFFWTILTTDLLAVGFVYLLEKINVWSRFPFTRFSFLGIMALCSILFGTVISLFLTYHFMDPVMRLSKAMQKVTEGDYTCMLDTSMFKHEFQKKWIARLYSDFNSMVKELNSTEMLHSDFISNVSHEFKTPLAAIGGYATLLQDDSLSSEERDEYIATIIQSTRELSKMTGNILSLSKLENQSIITEKESFRVDEQIRQVILRMEPAWTAKNLSINPELDSITWYGSQELSSHIWTNLLENAVKFTPEGGEIDITAHADKQWLTVIFRDTGIGMTKEIQKHIFDKFYQGDTSHKKKGNGLGLALIRQIVALHGGKIQVESCPDLGSTFKILLPMELSEQACSPRLL